MSDRQREQIGTVLLDVFPNKDVERILDEIRDLKETFMADIAALATDVAALTAAVAALPAP